MRRRGVLILTWLVATTLATGMAWIAVDGVTTQVSPPAALPAPKVPLPAQPPAAAGPRATAPPVDARQAPTGDSEAYRLVGGVVTVRYDGADTEMVQAVPSTGFVMDVHSGGPDRVDVRFRSDEHESRVRVEVRNGTPAPRIEERPR